MKNLIDICDYVWKRIILRHRDFPDGWMYKRDLIRMCGRITTDELSKALYVLEKSGYVKCEKIVQKKGRPAICIHFNQTLIRGNDLDYLLLLVGRD